ncbi:MAG: hypothetical protein HYY52_02240 [Candidatus Melainabacteria bacterium]|nr:hypothetical protein [Candidatus Melainabacteria bacterium]
MNTEPEPMKQIHDIREKNYHETKHMNAKEYLEHTRKKAAKFEEYKKTVKAPKDLDAFYQELKSERKAS